MIAHALFLREGSSDDDLTAVLTSVLESASDDGRQR